MTVAIAECVKRVQAGLAERAVPEDAAPMQRYMKTTQPFYGVKKPGRVKVARTLRDIPIDTPQDYQDCVMALWDLPRREERYLAVALARQRRHFVTLQQLPLYRNLIEAAAWWDLVDEVAIQLVGEVWRRDRGRVGPVMDTWIEAPSLWVRRAAIIGQVKHKTDTDVPRLLRYCDLCVGESDFFIRKGIGWALRALADHEPAPVIAWLQQNWGRASGLTRREASRKLIARGWTPPGPLSSRRAR